MAVSGMNTKKNTPRNDPKVKILLVLICTVSLAGAGYYVYRHMQTIEVPDPATASIDELAAFVNSEDFRSLSTKQRREFIDAVVRRTMEMDDEQWEEAREKLAVLDIKRLASGGDGKSVEFWKSYGANQAKRYAEMPSPQKDVFVDRMIGAVNLVGGRGSAEKLVERFEQDAMYDPFRKMTSATRKFTRNTTAVERAQMAKLGADTLQRFKQRSHGR